MQIISRFAQPNTFFEIVITNLNYTDRSNASEFSSFVLNVTDGQVQNVGILAVGAQWRGVERTAIRRSRIVSFFPRALILCGPGSECVGSFALSVTTRA